MWSALIISDVFHRAADSGFLSYRRNWFASIYPSRCRLGAFKQHINNPSRLNQVARALKANRFFLSGAGSESAAIETLERLGGDKKYQMAEALIKQTISSFILFFLCLGNTTPAHRARLINFSCERRERTKRIIKFNIYEANAMV